MKGSGKGILLSGSAESGSVEMVKIALIRISTDCKVELISIDSPMSGPAYQFFRLYAVPEKAIGTVEIQQLPDRRVLVMFEPTPPHTKIEDMTDAQLERFDQFVPVAVKWLLDLGFVPSPEPQQPKRPLGFAPD